MNSFVWNFCVDSHEKYSQFCYCMQSTVGFTDLDQSSEIIIFESIFTVFEASSIFWGSWGCSINWLELKIKPLLAYLVYLNWWNTLYNTKWIKFVFSLFLLSKLYFHFVDKNVSTELFLIAKHTQKVIRMRITFSYQVILKPLFPPKHFLTRKKYENFFWTFLSISTLSISWKKSEVTNSSITRLVSCLLPLLLL